MQDNRKTGYAGTFIAILGLVALVAGLILTLALPEIGIGALGIAGFGIILLVTAFIIDFRRVKRAVTGRRGRFGLGTGIMSFVFVGIVIFANAISTGHYERIDTSSLSQFTLTPQTVNVLNSLKSPVTAIGFFIPNDNLNIGPYLTDLLTVYASHTTKLTVQYIDPDQHPDQAKKYGITEYQTVVFESGDRRLLVPPSQFVNTDSSGNVTGINAEYAFTSALLQVTGVAQKKVYFLTGDGEGSIDSNFSVAKAGLQDDLYIVDTLNLITNPQVPADCNALIIAGPQSPFSPDELNAINTYLDNGGQALIMTNPGGPADIEKIVSSWGVDIGDGTVIDPSSYVAPHKDMPLVTSDRDYFGLNSVFFPGATAIIPQSNIPASIQLVPLAYTTSSSWLDKNFSAGTDPVFNPDTEKMAPLAIGVLIGASPNNPAATMLTRIAVIGDSDFASNDNFASANNGDLFLNSVNWLTEETSLISIHRNVQPFRRLVTTPGETNFIQYSSIILFPVILLLAAAVIWWRRR